MIDDYYKRNPGSLDMGARTVVGLRSQGALGQGTTRPRDLRMASAPLVQLGHETGPIPEVSGPSSCFNVAHTAKGPRPRATTRPTHAALTCGSDERSSIPVDPGARIDCINGIRGWASLSVVAFHTTWETFGVVFPRFRNPVTGFFLDGPLAVSIFFVVSGEALSAAFFSGGGRAAVMRLAAKRYSRLMLPIFACCALTYLVWWAGLAYNVQAGHIVHRMDWLGSWLNPAPKLKSVLSYAVWRVFTNVPASRALNPFLWTMRVEMWGSMMIFGLLLLLDKFRYVWLLMMLVFAYGAIRVLNGDEDDFGYCSCFLAGLTFAALRSGGYFSRAQNSRRVVRTSFVLVGSLAVLDGMSHWRGVGRQYTPLVAIVLVGAVFCNPWLSARFTTSCSLFLGKLSFSLYLVQFPVLISFTSYAIYLAHGLNGLTPLWIWVIDLASIGVTLAVAYAFQPVELLTRFVGNRIVGLLEHRGAIKERSGVQ